MTYKFWLWAERANRYLGFWMLGMGLGYAFKMNIVMSWLCFGLAAGNLVMAWLIMNDDEFNKNQREFHRLIPSPISRQTPRSSMTPKRFRWFSDGCAVRWRGQGYGIRWRLVRTRIIGIVFERSYGQILAIQIGLWWAIEFGRVWTHIKRFEE